MFRHTRVHFVGMVQIRIRVTFVHEEHSTSNEPRILSQGGFVGSFDVLYMIWEISDHLSWSGSSDWNASLEHVEREHVSHAKKCWEVADESHLQKLLLLRKCLSRETRVRQHFVLIFAKRCQKKEIVFIKRLQQDLPCITGAGDGGNTLFVCQNHKMRAYWKLQAR